MPYPFKSLHRLGRAAQHVVVAAVLAFSLSDAAGAQPASVDPLIPSASPLTYRSAFEGYRPFRADEPPSWQSVNDAVRAVGGHSGALKNAQTPMPVESQAPPQTAPEQPAPAALPREPVTTAPMHNHGH